MVKRKIVEQVRRYLEKVEETGMKINFGVVYGSYARGDANDLSDIDLIVVSEKFDPIHLREDIHRLWRIAGEVDNRIEPIACGIQEWAKEETPIINVAKREGIKVETGFSQSA